MRARSALRFAVGATVAAVPCAFGLLLWLAGGDPAAGVWATRGFLAMALPGVAAGAWMAYEHGRAGSRFVIALVAGMIARVLFAAIVALGAARAGGSASTGLLAGLAAGFVPVLLFEMAWFAGSRSAQGMGTETRG